MTYDYHLVLLEPTDTHSVTLTHNPTLDQFACRGCVLSNSIHEAHEYFDDINGVIIHLLRHELIGEKFSKTLTADLIKRFTNE